MSSDHNQICFLDLIVDVERLVDVERIGRTSLLGVLAEVGLAFVSVVLNSICVWTIF
jgi:hypothetical protein